MAAESQSPTGDPSPEIETEERAFVVPDDVNQLGNPESTQEKLRALVERLKAEENTQGGLWSQAAKWLPLLGALILGWWFGTQTGGSGGGESEGGSSVSPIMADVGAGVVDAAAQTQTLALEAGVGAL